MTAVPVTVLYFGALREAAGRDSEQRITAAEDCQALWQECAAAHRIGCGHESLRVAVNGEFASWGHALNAHAEVAFMPPFAGG